MDLGRLLVRLTIGGTFFVHGTQKLFGWFGGYGPEGTGQFMEALGLRPGRRQALTAGTSETVGGALLALGALTPLATTLITAAMETAIRTAHAGKGPWISEGGWEYPAVIMAGLFPPPETRPRPASGDQAP